MLARRRQARILEWIRQVGAIRVTEFVHELGVSDMTVRRDLAALAEQGFLEKVHGGATLVLGSALVEPGFTAKSTLQPAEKAAIAAEARPLWRRAWPSGSPPAPPPPRWPAASPRCPDSPW